MHQCGKQMTDSGRLMDYYDDYSAYMEIDLMKMEDGYLNSFSGAKMPPSIYMSFLRIR